MTEINDTEELPETISPVNLNLIDQYQEKHHILMAEYNMGTYNTGSFRGVINIDINLITCRDKIFILLILKSYALNWCHNYILHPGMDRTEVMICNHFTGPILQTPSERKEIIVTLSNVKNGQI